MGSTGDWIGDIGAGELDGVRVLQAKCARLLADMETELARVKYSLLCRYTEERDLEHNIYIPIYQYLRSDRKYARKPSTQPSAGHATPMQRQRLPSRDILEHSTSYQRRLGGSISPRSATLGISYQRAAQDEHSPPTLAVD